MTYLGGTVPACWTGNALGVIPVVWTSLSLAIRKSPETSFGFTKSLLQSASLCRNQQGNSALLHYRSCRNRLKTTDTAILDGQRVYYSHIRPHQALNGKTPAQVAGIDLDLGVNKWESIIKKASTRVRDSS
jgi:hypothetical protein